LLEVNPLDCPTIEHWRTSGSNLYKYWRYWILGGNHGARRQSDLWRTYEKPIYKKFQAWVYAGLNDEQRKFLAWSHNCDQEYRKGMSNIDQIWAIHAMFIDGGMEKKKELTMKIGREIHLPFDPNVRDSLSKHDGMFQIAFQTGELWDLQDKIFTMWIKLQTKGQKTDPRPAFVTKAKGRKTQRETIKNYQLI
jgi:hypothetical protein